MPVWDRFVGSAKAALTRLGIFVVRRRHLPFGVDFILDISRLSASQRAPVHTAFDVGANLGQTSTKLLAAFPSARVVAFEPHPDTFQRLIDGYRQESRFTAFNLALGDTVGLVDFFEYGSSTVNSLVPNSRHAVHFAEHSHRRQVECTTLDAFCVQRGIASIDVLKIDVEGFEIVVLKGARNLLATGKIRFIYVEYNDISVDGEAFGGSLVEIEAFLRQFGFRFVSSYTDNVVLDDSLFIVANALFVLAPPPTGTRNGATP